MKKLISIFIFLIISSTYVFANQFYVGLDMAKIKVETGIKNVSSNLDEDDTLMKFTGGYNVDENVSIEAFYLDFGEASLSGVAGNRFKIDGSTYQFTSSGKIAISADTMGIGGKYNFYRSENKKAAIYLLGGIHSWDISAEVSSNTTSVSASDTGTDPYYGFGANYLIYENIRANISYQNYEMDSDSIDGFVLGLEYGF